MIKVQLINSDFSSKNRQIDIDNLFLFVRNLEQKQYYKAKLSYFRKLLSRIKKSDDKDINPFSLSENFCLSYLPFDANRLSDETSKEKILRRLITLSEHLTFSHEDDYYESEFKILEQELNGYLDFFDRLLLQEETYTNLFHLDETAIKIKHITKLLSSVIKKTLLNLARDLRQLFRNIFNFLFKNLDDEADNKIALNSTILTAILYQLKPRQYDNRRDCISFKYNT